VGRELRIIDCDCWYHVTCRGSNRGTIAWDRHDYASLEGELARAAVRYAWQLAAWCFMPNHYHLVLRTPRGGFSEGLQVMNGTHSRRTNRRHGRTDHLFRNRPLARRISSDAHLVAAILYVIRNPVKAGLCRTAGEWPYSSYRATVGAGPAPPWLAVDEIYGFFGSTRAEAQAEFARLVHERHLPVSDTEVATPE
jgi:REP element-mobilizing transposase RayT